MNITKYLFIILLTSCANSGKPSLQEVQRLCGGGDVEKYHYSDDESNMRISCQKDKS